MPEFQWPLFFHMYVYLTVFDPGYLPSKPRNSTTKAGGIVLEGRSLGECIRSYLNRVLWTAGNSSVQQSPKEGSHNYAKDLHAGDSPNLVMHHIVPKYISTKQRGI